MAPRIDLGDITHHNVNILKLINQKVFPVNYNVRWALLVLFLFFKFFDQVLQGLDNVGQVLSVCLHGRFGSWGNLCTGW